MENLSDHAANITSQAGENGILAEIMRRLDIQQGTCIEFGAGDGKTISNTHPFWHDGGWHAVLIEPDGSAFTALEQRIDEFKRTYQQKHPFRWDITPPPSVLAIRAIITHDGPHMHEGNECGNTLDEIVAMVNLNFESEMSGDQSFKDIDLLSIDIDGNDYHVWKAFRKHTAKCVVIEYTAAFPPHIEYVVPAGEHMTTGSSMLAMVNLGKEKGYTLVAATSTNLVFVRDEFMDLLGNVCTDPVRLHDPDWCTYVIGEMSGRRAWITKKHPNHYYLESDMSLRFKVIDQSLYPVHMHRADWNELSGRFRIDGDELRVLCFDSENVYTNTADHLDALPLSLDRLYYSAQAYGASELLKEPGNAPSKSAPTIQLDAGNRE